MIPILMYHQIAHVPTEHDPKGLAVTPEAFDAQMNFLHKAGFRCIDLDKAVEIYESGQPSPSKTVVITFDDGFSDLYTTVWPIMDRYNYRATIFFVAGSAGVRSNWDGQDGEMAAPLMTWDEVREMQEAGFTFASHTVSHAELTTLDEVAIRQELRQSKTILEDQLGRPVSYFSYPYSQQTPRIQDIVRECGYTAACGGDDGSWTKYNMLRTQCGAADSLRTFSFKAHGYYDHINRLRHNPLMRTLFRGPWRKVRQIVQMRS